MKKTSKTILTIAGSCILLGIVITIIFAMTGGNQVFNNNGSFNFAWNDDNFTYETVDKSFEGNFKNLRFDIPYGNVEFVQGEKFNLKVENAVVNTFNESRVNGDTLEIKQHYPKGYGFFGNSSIWNGMKKPEVTITIPENFEAGDIYYNSGVGVSKIAYLNGDKIEIDLGTGDTEIKNIKVKNEANISSGVGRVTINDLSCDILKLDSGVGEISGTKINANQSDVSTGTGKIQFNDSNMKDLSVDGGVGEFTYNGIISGDTEINGGVGSVTFNISGNYDDYFIKNSDGVGHSYLNGKKIGDETGNRNAPNKIDIEGGVGEIKINTSNK